MHTLQQSLPFRVKKWGTDLARTHFVEGDECECLGEHRGWEVLFSQDDGNQDTRKSDLRHKRHGLDPHGRKTWEGGGEVQLCVVGAEVMTMVDAANMVEVCVCHERQPITIGARERMLMYGVWVGLERPTS